MRTMLLQGKKGLVLNVTNRNSIGWSIAEAAANHGAKVGIGAQNDKMAARVQELIEGDERFTPFMVDFSFDDQLEQLVEDVRETYGSIDFVVHSAAYANKEDLAGRYIDTSRAGFAKALDVSCYSFVALCRVLEPVLADDASVITISYLGSVRVVGNYNVMGVAKAALEASARYLSADLGARGIRVNVLSPGPINTVAARGVRGLLDMIGYVEDRAPLKRPYGQAEVGQSSLYLLSDLSKGVTGQVIYIDSGYNIVGL